MSHVIGGDPAKLVPLSDSLSLSDLTNLFLTSIVLTCSIEILSRSFDGEPWLADLRELLRAAQEDGQDARAGLRDILPRLPELAPTLEDDDSVESEAIATLELLGSWYSKRFRMYRVVLGGEMMTLSIIDLIASPQPSLTDRFLDVVRAASEEISRDAGTRQYLQLVADLGDYIRETIGIFEDPLLYVP